MVHKCSWKISPTQHLSMDIYDKNDGWRNVPGLYIFAKRYGDYWQAIYIGQTDNFNDRLPHHGMLNDAVRMGATHIHAVIVESSYQRDAWEKALIQIYQPPLNTQHR